MKTLPSLHARVTRVLSLCAFLLAAMTAQADRWATLSGLNDSLTIAEGETALVVFVPGSQVTLTYQKTGGPAVTLDLDGSNRGSINGNRGQVNGSSPLPLAGPATVILNNTTVVGLKVVPTDTPSQPSSALASTPPEGGTVPSNAVVIPSGSAGPVQILLEASPDLVTWNSAEPGTYGAASTNRFFRVRAVIP